MFNEKSQDCYLGCFPSTARVNLENGKSVMMSELQVGDIVQTGNIDFFLMLLDCSMIH